MIGPIVKQFRLQRNLSQETLANNAHVSSGYLSKLERGVYKEPSIEVLSRIAAALSIAPLELYRAAGIEHLYHQQDPSLGSLVEAFTLQLDDLPRRDREIILSELRRILRDEIEAPK